MGQGSSGGRAQRPGSRGLHRKPCGMMGKGEALRGRPHGHAKEPGFYVLGQSVPKGFMSGAFIQKMTFVCVLG